MQIHSLSEVDFTKSVVINFLATVLSVDSDGDGNKKPFKATIKLEDSGENIQISSWKFEFLPLFKQLVSSDDVYMFEGIANTYKETEKQIRIGDIKDAHMKSAKKIIKTVNTDTFKQELTTILDTYLSYSGPYSIYRKVIDILVMNNEKFWKWPAATSVHHAYPGGLAKHTLSVVKNAISIWKTYEGENLNIAIIVAGAVLHDIGKIMEYNIDGTRTVYGNLIPHPIAGYEKFCNEISKLGLDPEKDTYTIMIGHILITHHEKLEFGASTQINILEALVVARADALDAAMDASENAIDMVELNTNTNRLMALDGSKLFKWHH